MKKSLLFLIAGSLALSTALYGADYRENMNLFNKAVAAKDLAGAQKYADELIKQLKDIQQPNVALSYCTVMIRTYQNAKDLKTADKLYKAMIAATNGNDKATLMTRYADFLKQNKLAKADEINKIKADRYKVKGISDYMLFDMLAADKRLEEADAVAKKLPQDSRTVAHILSAFQKNGFYGSAFAQKYYKKHLELTTDPVRKIQEMQKYADYCRTYALMSDEEIDKFLTTRSQVPGITDAGRFEIKLYDLQKAPDNETRIKIARELIGLVKTENQNNALISGMRNLGTIPEVFEIYEKHILPYGKTAGHITHCAANYTAASKNAGRYKDAEKYITAFALKGNTAGHYKALGAFYEVFAQRYYAEQDPVLLKKAMAAYQKVYSLSPEDDYYTKMEMLLRLTDLSRQINDRNGVERYAKQGMAMEIPEKYRLRQNCENAKAFLFVMPRVQAAYAEHDYETVVKILEPVIGKRQHYPGASSPDSGTAYEILVRSFVALKQYENAFKYTDDMIRTAPYYMRQRLTVQVNELKQRIGK